MTKPELAAAIADGSEVTEKPVLWAIDPVCEAIAGALERGDAVILPGFGKFSVVERAARQARDARSGEPIALSARLVPRFSPAAALKQAVARSGTPANG